MGKVYRAEQTPLGRLVALKVLTAHHGEDDGAEFQKRFFLEASIASKLTHPNTVTIHDYGKTDDDVYYIAMELLEGRTLHRALRDEGPFSPERTVHVARQICRALREAHGLGVIHRDLKPANIFLVSHGDEKDFVKVLDFGLVKNLEEKGEQLTQTGLFMGSPKYMAPEQVRGERVDPRVDIYALGVVMCELLTGRVPYDDAHSVNILMAHVHDDLPPLNILNPTVHVPVELERIARKCLAKRPEDRWANMDQILTALKQFSDSDSSVPGGIPVATAPAARTPTEPLKLPFSQAARPSGGAGPLALALLFVLTSVGGFFALSRPATSEPPKPMQASSEAARVEPAAHERHVMISLRSSPPGAMVVVGDKQYGPTPTEVELSGEEAEAGREITFRFRRTGFRALTVSRRIRGERMEVDAAFLDPISDTR
jgi:eukaryotic-like serine/threonine-protein kinase